MASVLSYSVDFIDLHTHGIGRYDTRTGRPEDILKMADIEAKAGVSAILPTVYPASIADMRRDIAAVQTAMEANGSGCRILGVNLEGPFLNPSRCGALDKDFLIKPSISKLKKLIDGFEDIVRIMTIAPELPNALNIIERCAGMGIKVNMGHSDATFKQALGGKKAGATGVTHIFNAMRPFHHREPGLAGFGLIDKDIYIEVIADGIHINLEVLRLIFMLKPAERIIIVSDSIKGPQFKSGVLQGAKSTVSDAAMLLGNLGIPQKGIRLAASGNPKNYLT